MWISKYTSPFTLLETDWLTPKSVN